MSGLAVLRHIDRVELAAWICLAYRYTLTSRATVKPRHVGGTGD